MVITIGDHFESYSIPIEISPDKCLYINFGLRENQQENLVKVLKEQLREIT